MRISEMPHMYYMTGGHTLAALNQLHLVYNDYVTCSNKGVYIMIDKEIVNFAKYLTILTRIEMIG